ncbi:DUF4334 domain-containing protein [Spongiivirga citrea]|uniref:DUF4334 domain-containing protein n=1 Tax=Spongiivirga citrea TaxID=1481457 RepID=A0A6M0CSR9_9FLAO|nr:DUF4334 domain-containing protein [Spongiivirga citrea]NER18959.1 DUF4334 domain-containing protein [Spongiivirga citrea]
MTNQEATAKFHQLTNSQDVIAFSELAEVFSELDPLNIDEILGSWKGGFFKTGRLIDWALKDYGIIKWIGKNYISENKVKALRYCFLGLNFSMPIIGRARVRHLAFREKVSTAMIYNHLPIIDHFRKVDDDTLMGVMDFKGKIVLYFYLYR